MPKTVHDLTVGGRLIAPGVMVERSVATNGPNRNFRNVANYEAAASVTGAIVIQTRITISAMFRIGVRSYLYTSAASHLLDLVAVGYATTGPTVGRHAVIHNGSNRPAVQYGFNASGELALILGNVSSVWDYPKVHVPYVNIGHSAASEAMGNNWAITLETDISAWATGLVIASVELPNAPIVHAAQHKLAGADPIKLNELALPTAAVVLNAQKLTGVADPTAAQDAATKFYVDKTATKAFAMAVS